MKILNVIEKMLLIKKAISIADIAKVTDKKHSYILDVLTKPFNHKHLVFDDSGRITRVKRQEYAFEERTKKYDSGFCYKIEAINYGVQRVIVFSNNITKYDYLKTNYICGGIGDSYTVEAILDTPENRNKINLVEFSQVYITPFEMAWVE